MGPRRPRAAESGNRIRSGGRRFDGGFGTQVVHVLFSSPLPSPRVKQHDGRWRLWWCLVLSVVMNVTPRTAACSRVWGNVSTGCLCAISFRLPGGHHPPEGRINDRLCTVLTLDLEHVALHLSDVLEIGVTGIQQIAVGYLFGSSEVNHVCI